MKTRITQNIDGYDIIIGIGEAQIDGVATLPIVNEALKLTDEYKSVEAKKQELSVVLNQAASAMKNARDSKTQSDKNKFVAEYQQNLEKSKAVESELKELIEPLQEKQKELILKHAIYFQPKEGETIITPEEAEIIEQAMNEATLKNCYLDVNMKQLCDNRGKTAWIKSGGKWSSREISKIGDEIKSGEITEINAEISEQLESERIAKLTTAQKEAEKTAIISGLASRANAMRGELEIQGDAAALKKSQDWYKAEVEKVQARYQ